MEKEFIIPNNTKQAVGLKNENYVYLAGGTEINRLNSSIAEKNIISLKRLGLNQITRDSENIYIGATCTFQQIYENKYIPDFLKKACLFMASRTKRNMATIGGNVALLRTDSYLIPSLVVAKAKLLIQNINSEPIQIEISDYLNNWKTYRDSLIISVIISRSSYSVISKRCSNTALSHSIINVAISRIDKEFYLFAGLKNVGFADFCELSSAMNSRCKLSCDQVLQYICNSSEIKFFDDFYGSIDYKRYILGVSIYEIYCELLKGGSK